ncbi:tyrosine-type recombinase/integrase [Burkholderia cepacia]|nr:tyrosine-type recombinase/integrase [Burkholderia cepacia]MCA8465797.1 tyrosine-type recombinase/integrase [Burkholderia cepacia]MDN7765903.1 tyrosine-type recombinase/integrase [Burkholderia cepacia]QCY07176.1 hypothetical protein EJ998_29870 [Burkholderia cepacia ATCC 25416]
MLALLESKQVTGWHRNQTKGAEGEDDLRKARDSANRNLKSLKAALNFARDNKWVDSDLQWKVVKYFEKVDMGRDGFLTVEQRNHLLNCMPEDLRLFATALMLLGCRPGELVKARVSDYNPHSGTLILRPSKTKSRTITLSTRARELFDAQAKDRGRDAYLFVTDHHKKWTVHFQDHPAYVCTVNPFRVLPPTAQRARIRRHELRQRVCSCGGRCVRECL